MAKTKKVSVKKKAAVKKPAVKNKSSKKSGSPEKKVSTVKAGKKSVVKKAAVKKPAVKKAVKKAVQKSSGSRTAVRKVNAQKSGGDKTAVTKTAAKKISVSKLTDSMSKEIKKKVKKVLAKSKAKLKSVGKPGKVPKIIRPVIKSSAEPEVKTVKQKKFKPNKKVKYNTSELKFFRNIILHERKAILESAKANMEALVDKDSGEYKGDNLTYSSHMAEQGTDEMEREKNYLFVQRDEKYLGYLQDALMRIDQGTYGICADCKDEPKNLCRTCPLIDKERLELVPITQHCIECKNLRG
ncbi:MAG: conjugal transfer protein TraR [Bacteroidetes bacterium]|nr:conjugal transfer protein TraR [Bacteroidota bacterium]